MDLRTVRNAHHYIPGLAYRRAAGITADIFNCMSINLLLLLFIWSLNLYV